MHFTGGICIARLQDVGVDGYGKRYRTSMGLVEKVCESVLFEHTPLTMLALLALFRIFNEEVAMNLNSALRMRKVD